MRFLAILICLAFERWTSFNRVIRQNDLFKYYLNLMDTITKKIKLNKYLKLSFDIIPLLIIVLIIWILLLKVLFGLFAFLFSIVVLCYCLGNFDLTSEDDEIGHIFLRANSHIFSILFWFGILGPVGAVLIRFTSVLVNENVLSDRSEAAKQLQQVLDWVPIRLETFSFALVSHFVKVLSCWTKTFFSGLNRNADVLVECGMTAIDESAEDVSIEARKAAAMAIIDRGIIVWLVVMALTILI